MPSTDPEARRRTNVAWRQRHPERSRAASKRWAEENADHVKDKRLQRKFGITLEQYKVMLEAQGSACAICKGESSGKGGFHVDHDHSSGKVRGLLCYRCNIVLGMMAESPDRLRAAAEYLERTK